MALCCDGHQEGHVQRAPASLVAGSGHRGRRALAAWRVRSDCLAQTGAAPGTEPGGLLPGSFSCSPPVPLPESTSLCTEGGERRGNQFNIALSRAGSWPLAPTQEPVSESKATRPQPWFWKADRVLIFKIRPIRQT